MVSSSPDPRVSSGELPGLVARLRKAIRQAETRDPGSPLPEAAFAAFPSGASLRAVYAAPYEVRVPGFRRAAVEELLALLDERLAAPRREVPARAIGDRAPREVTLGEGDTVIPAHRVPELRFWGTGLRFDREEHDFWYAGELARGAIRGLATSLGDLVRVETWLASLSRLRAAPRLVPPLQARQFEQILLDILNETEPVARRARLAEDFLEKTDLRVRVPGVERRRGVRVQVTASARESVLRGKAPRTRGTSRAARAARNVILSPHPLMEFGLTHVERYFSHIDPAPGSREELSARIRDSLTRSWEGDIPAAGPVERVPQGIRDLVRDYVATEARRPIEE